MIHLTVTEISKAVKGKLHLPDSMAEPEISQIVTDSRTYFKKGNSIFFAFTGPRNNGHHYIPALIQKGIRAFVVSEESSITSNAAFILVKNTKEALQKLAKEYRKKFNYTTIGITGSNGKTIVKEWLHDLLSGNFKIVRSPKSYNSQTGVPLSVLLMNEKYNLGIFEAGISCPGEMIKLKDIISPNIGIFTNIGDAHQENFTSLKQKINEKLLLFRNVSKLIFCADQEHVKDEITTFCAKHGIKQYSWSKNDITASVFFDTISKDYQTEISASCNNNKYRFTLPFSDKSSIENACHCFTCLIALGENPDLYQKKFNLLDAVPMRLEIKQGINNCILINDYYNSDLNSLSIALSVLNQQASKKYLNKLVILSDIKQSGLEKEELYEKVNQLLTEWKIDEFIGIGPEISRYFRSKDKKVSLFNSFEQFRKYFERRNFNSKAILIKGARQFTFENISSLLQLKTHQTVLEIDMDALVNNLNTYKSLLKPKTKIMVMVKAFSYGTGDTEIAKLLQFQNADYLAVAVADEGIQLRNSGIHTPIIVMNPEQDSFQNIIDYHLEPNIYCLELLNNFQLAIAKNDLDDYPVHLKIDTGMNRLGFKDVQTIQQAVSKIKVTNRLKIVSAFSHLSGSDDPNLDDFTLKQIEKFEGLVAVIRSSFPYKINRHILNSAGIERFPEYQYEMVRLGIGLYGVSVSGLPLQHIGTLKSIVSQVKTVNEDETVGYSRKGKLTKSSRIATIPIGYADGIDRRFGNGNGTAFVNGQRVPVIGNICMDMLMLDVTGVDVAPGDQVEFFGNNITISELAEKAETIPYEILTGISQRVKRIYLQA